jgi:hypothetical protein
MMKDMRQFRVSILKHSLENNIPYFGETGVTSHKIFMLIKIKLWKEKKKTEHQSADRLPEVLNQYPPWTTLNSGSLHVCMHRWLISSPFQACKPEILQSPCGKNAERVRYFISNEPLSMHQTALPGSDHSKLLCSWHCIWMCTSANGKYRKADRWPTIVMVTYITRLNANPSDNNGKAT